MFKIGDRVRFKEKYRNGRHIFKVSGFDGSEEILNSKGTFIIDGFSELYPRIRVYHPRITVYLPIDWMELAPSKRIVRIV